MDPKQVKPAKQFIRWRHLPSKPAELSSPGNTHCQWLVCVPALYLQDTKVARKSSGLCAWPFGPWLERFALKTLHCWTAGNAHPRLMSSSLSHRSTLLSDMYTYCRVQLGLFWPVWIVNNLWRGLTELLSPWGMPVRGFLSWVPWGGKTHRNVGFRGWSLDWLKAGKLSTGIYPWRSAPGHDCNVLLAPIIMGCNLTEPEHPFSRKLLL